MTDPERHNQSERESAATTRTGQRTAESFVAPGVPIVRDSTPRPASFEAGLQHLDRHLDDNQGALFPDEAPGAPPVPEEFSPLETTPLPLTSQGQDQAEAPPQEQSEFVWLFAYGPEMDTTLLNSPERLAGLALFYGLGQLKGYKLAFGALSPQTHGPVIASILASDDPGALVWGSLYRIPRRLIEGQEGSPPLLDQAHQAGTPGGPFEVLNVSVHDPQRQRDLACITYIAASSIRSYFQQRLDASQFDATYLQRLLESARRVKLPEEYLHDLAKRTNVQTPAAAEARTNTEQITEPLPAMREESLVAEDPHLLHAQPPLVQERWLRALALYLVLLLLFQFILGVLVGLGLGKTIFTDSFTPLGVPWFVFVYGLLGGSVSTLVTLRRYAARPLPSFLLLSWFARPYLGIILAILVYLVLDSGFFVLISPLGHNDALFSLVAILAGLSEGWLFYRRL